ncbi:hypothetical protein JCM11491_004301 [Sporobolomyces phaffii]
MDLAHRERPRPRSAVVPPTQFLSPIDPTLDSYAFPPAPRSADVLQTFAPSPPPTSDIAEQQHEATPEPDFSYQPPPLSHFLSPETARSRDDAVRGDTSPQYSAPPLSSRPRFSTLGQAIYDGTDARAVLSSFSFANLLNPFRSEEPPPSPRRRRADYGQSLVYEGRSPPLVPIVSESRPRPRATLPPVLCAPRSPSVQPHYAFPSPVVPHRQLDSGWYPRESTTRRDFAELGSSRPTTRGVRSLVDCPRLGSPISFASPPVRDPSSSSSSCTASPSHPPRPEHTSSPPSSLSASSAWSTSTSTQCRAAPTKGPAPSTNSRSVVGVYRPSPQSMLAPEAVRDVAITLPPLAAAGSRVPRRGGGCGGAAPARGVGPSRAWNAPAIDPNLDFDSLPTKASRGRKPLTVPELELAHATATAAGGEGGRGTHASDDARVEATAGTDKNGKAKKVWLCKVKDCGRVFKRGEHLQRHVRSIHTGEKPFQCQWTGCGKYFSRHDNLNQHLRVHRKPGQSVEEFSAQIEACFSRRLRQVEQESAEYKRQAQEAALARERRGYVEAADESRPWTEREEPGAAVIRREEEEEEEESIYAPPPVSLRVPFERVDRGGPAKRRRTTVEAVARSPRGASARGGGQSESVAR